MDFEEELTADIDRTWMQHAACRGLPADLFHPQKGENKAQADALRICNGNQKKVKDFTTQKFHLVGPPPCPVKEDCYNYVMSLSRSQDMCGVYAGLSHKQRNRIRTRLAKETVRVKVRPRCGTVNGYVWHRRNNEAPCEACRRENARYKQEKKQQKAS